jgi:hypothetical protein
MGGGNEERKDEIDEVLSEQEELRCSGLKSTLQGDRKGVSAVWCIRV